MLAVAAEVPEGGLFPDRDEVTGKWELTPGKGAASEKQPTLTPVALEGAQGVSSHKTSPWAAAVSARVLQRKETITYIHVVITYYNILFYIALHDVTYIKYT